MSKERLRITLYSQIKKEKEEEKKEGKMNKRQERERKNAEAYGGLAGMKRAPVIRMQYQITDDKVFNIFKDVDNSAQSTKAT